MNNQETNPIFEPFESVEVAVNLFDELILNIPEGNRPAVAIWIGRLFATVRRDMVERVQVELGGENE